MRLTFIACRLLLLFFLSQLLLAAGCKGNSSKPFFVIPHPVTPAIITISAIGGDGLVSLNWNGIGDAASYDLYRSLSSGSQGTLIATFSAATTSYTDTALSNGTQFFYTLLAKNAGGTVLVSSQLSATPNPPGGSVTISGTVHYQDKVYDTNGFTGSQPYKTVRYADVELVSDTGSGILSATTDSNGLFSFGTISQPTSTVYVRVSAAATPPESPSQITIKDLSQNLYAALSGTFVPTGSASVNLLVTSGSIAGAFNILDVFTNGFEFVYKFAGAYPPSLTGYWQKGNTSGTFYCTGPAHQCGNEGIYILNTRSDTDEYDDDVLYHEFGHFAAAHFSKDDSIGGVHSLFDNDLDLRLSWSEGWGDSMPGNVKRWLSSMGRQDRLSSAANVPLTEYVDTTSSGAGIAFDMGNPSGPHFVYAGSEVAVAKILLDLNENFGMQYVWGTIADFKTNVASTPSNLELFWDRWHSLSATSGLTIDTFFEGRLISYPTSSNTVSTSTYTVNTSGPQNFVMGGNGDVNVISFTTGTGRYTVSTSNLINGADTYLELYSSLTQTIPLISNDNTSGFNSWGSQVPTYFPQFSYLIDSYGIHHDNGQDVLGSRLQFTTSSSTGPYYPGTYYLKVFNSPDRPVSAGRYGSYTVTITSP